MRQINGQFRLILLIGSIFSLVGIGLIIGACVAYVQQREFLRQSLPGVGTVVDHEERRSRDSKTGRVSVSYAPVVEFKTSNGVIHRFTSSVSSNPPDQQVGETVNVVYSPQNPEKAEVNNFISLWIGPVICGGLGIVFAPVGISLLTFGLKRRL